MTQLHDAALQVQKLVELHQLSNFVETGCFHGDGLSYARALGFKKLYSCDVNANYIHGCKQRIPEATIVHQDSIAFFTNMLPRLEGPTLFWLDAHYPTYYGTSEENDLTKFPLVDEMKLVATLKKDFQKDVIICDDLRVLDAKDNPYYNGGLNQYFYVQHSVHDLINVLRDTHNYSSVQAETGVLIFVPK